MTSLRLELLSLTEDQIPSTESTAAASSDSASRPLAQLSDFVCTEIGTYNDLIREGEMPASTLWDAVDSRVRDLPDALFSYHLAEASQAERRLALLDLVWAERSLNIAFGSSSDYKHRRDTARFFKKAVELAEAERRHPMLSWSDIASHHPAADPRSFLIPGEDQDQEILMYRIQRLIELVFTKTLRASVTAESLVAHLEELTQDLDAVLRSMIHLSRVRRVGQFYKLDPFLGLNGEYRGHGTGAFSVWTFLIGVHLTGNENFLERLRDPANRMAYDHDADPLLDAAIEGQLPTLDQLVESTTTGHAEAHRLLQGARKKFAQFLQSHRGAMRKHSKASFGDEAPSYPTLTNSESIDAAINDAT